MNKVFLGSALFAPVGGLIGIVAAKSLDDNSPLSTEGKTATTIAVDKPEETIAVASAPAENAANIIPETESEEMHINFISDLPCGHPSDNLSFGEAFREQRNILGQGGVFEYQGKYYNINTLNFTKMEQEKNNKDQSSLEKEENGRIRIGGGMGK